MDALPALNTFDAILQVLLLSAGIYLLLSFLRTTRGTGIVRGLGIGLLGGGMTLWLVSQMLELDEVLRVFDAIAQVAVIMLAILFHPELRRGISRLGEHELLGRFLRNVQAATVEEVALSAISMAKDRVGALIVFERRTPLESFVDRSVPIGAQVTRHLIETIFHPGNRLHDGAIIVRGNQVEAASCILPLTENQDLGKTVGTRHRAALGLSEETDAVVLVVSEETGSISICKEGRMERRVARDAVKEMLLDALGGSNLDEEKPKLSLPALFWGWLKSNRAEKVMALSLGLALYVGAWRAGRSVQEFTLDLQVQTAREGRVAGLGELLVLTPEAISASVLTRSGQSSNQSSVRVVVRAPRDLLGSLGGSLAGRVELKADGTGERDLSTGEVRWSGSRAFDPDELDVSWKTVAPRLVLREYTTTNVTLTAQMVEVDTTQLGTGWSVDPASLSFLPSEVLVRAPLGAEGSLEEQLIFETVVLPKRRNEEWTERPLWNAALDLSGRSRDDGIELLGLSNLLIKVVPAMESVGHVELDVAVVSLDPTAPDAPDLWEAPSKKVRVEVRAKGIFTGSDEEDGGLRVALLEAIRESAHAFVNVSNQKLESTEFPVQLQLPGPDAWLLRVPQETRERLRPLGVSFLDIVVEPGGLTLRPKAKTEPENTETSGDGG
jgi:diadenylate cyclase